MTSLFDDAALEAPVRNYTPPTPVVPLERVDPALVYRLIAERRAERTASMVVGRAKHIIAECSLEARLSPYDIPSNRRARYIVNARHKAMYRLYMETALSYPQIGHLLNKDHASVMNGVRRHARLNGLPMPGEAQP